MTNIKIDKQFGTIDFVPITNEIPCWKLLRFELKKVYTKSSFQPSKSIRIVKCSTEDRVAAETKFWVSELRPNWWGPGLMYLSHQMFQIPSSKDGKFEMMSLLKPKFRLKWISKIKLWNVPWLKFCSKSWTLNHRRHRRLNLEVHEDHIVCEVQHQWRKCRGRKEKQCKRLEAFENLKTPT